MTDRLISESRYRIRQFGYVPDFGGGAETDRIVHPYLSTTYDLAGSWSICTWLYPRSAGASNAGRILDKSAAYLFFTAANNALSMANGGSTKTSRANIYSYNRWSFVAATYDGSYVYFYVNCQLVDRVAQTTNPSVNGGNIQLGNAAGASNARCLDGRIAELALFKDRVLTQTELRLRMNGWFDDTTGLILFDKLTEPSGDAIDSSSYANNGVVTGATREIVTDSPTPNRTSVISV